MKKYFNFLINTFKYFNAIRRKKIIINKTHFSYLSQIRHLREKGTISIGASSYIDDYNILSVNNGFIEIGEHSSLNPFCVLYGHGGIKIGNGVRIASHTTIAAFNHNYSDINQFIHKQKNIYKGIIIEDDVWIGSGTKILDGVIIGKGCVIGANSVVKNHLEPYGVYAGVPCKLIKKRVKE